MNLIKSSYKIPQIYGTLKKMYEQQQQAGIMLNM
jgi:hypothetical protein